MVNAQEWLNQRYLSQKTKETVKNLVIRHGGGIPMDINVLETEIIRDICLEGEMALNDFPNLEKFVLSSDTGQKVTIIKAEKLTKLTYIHLNHCPDLTFVDFSNCAELNWILVRACPKLKFLNFLDSWKQQNQQFSNILFPNQPHNFNQLRQELKRLKIQDLTLQIPLKKQELEQLTNNAKEKLTRAEQYPLEKLLKKHSKTLQGSNNLKKVNELKEILNEKLTQEELQALLNKQEQVFSLEKHLENLQQNQEQVAQIQQANLPPQC